MRSKLSRASNLSYLALIAVLPLHTVFLRVEIAWKPWIVLLAAVVLLDLSAERKLPWDRRATIGVAVFLAAAAISWPGPGAGPQFWRLWLALVLGGSLLLTVGRHAETLDATLKAVFWSSAAVATTGLALAMVTTGVFGEDVIDLVNDLPLVDRVNKEAYLSSGFLALTNWHQDPGYSALWANVWLVLAAFAWRRGVVGAPRWVGPLVLGGLIFSSILTFSRTGWLGVIVAILVVIFVHGRSGDLGRGGAVRLVFASVGVTAALLVGLIAIDPEGVGGDVVTALEFRLSYLAEFGFIDTGEPGVIDPDLVVADNRLDVWSEYWSRFIESPIRGIGLGTGWSEPGLQEPHNMWLELLAETGLIGLAGFGFMAWSIRRRPSPEATAVGVVVLLATMTQTVLFEPVLWLALGLWLAADGGKGSRGRVQRAAGRQGGSLKRLAGTSDI